MARPNVAVAEGSPDGAAVAGGARTAMGKARNSLDPKKPQFSQVELCEVAEIPMATANNWILTGALRPADVGSRRARKPRLFSVVTIFEAKVTGDLVKWLGTPPPIAAGMARKTTDGHNWYWSISRDLARNNSHTMILQIDVRAAEQSGRHQAELARPGGRGLHAKPLAQI